MKHINDIVPYSEFWGNCITNMFTSILQKDYPSYVPLIYLNSYEYFFCPFRLDYTKKYYDFFGDNIFIFNRYNFANRENFLPELKNIIINNPYVTLYVDLFYWNKDCTYYNRLHSNHFAFITGFDEEDVFYTFEEDVSLNYGIRKIPTQSVIQAFHSEFKQDFEDYRIITFKNTELQTYFLDFNNIKADAERLIFRSNEFIERKHALDEEFPLTEITNVHHYTYEFGKVSNRMKGNIILFEKLRDSDIISKELSDELIVSAEEMVKMWMFVKNNFFRHCLRKNFSEIEKVENRISELFIKERDMWSKVMAYQG